MKAAIYIRVSSEEQIEGYSLHAQERACRLYAKLHGWRVVGVWADEGVSGRRADRPAFREMLVAVESGRANAVIVHKLDRLARNAEYGLRVINDFSQRGVVFACVVEQIDGASPMGKLLLTILLAVAEWFSNNLSTETAKGLREKAQQGLWVGTVPYGYRWADHAAGIEPHPDEAPTVQQIFALYHTGAHSYQSIMRELNAGGQRPRSGGPWATSSVRDILSNRAYCGYVHCGEEFQGRHLPLISEEIWEHCAALRQARAPSGQRTKGSPPRLVAYCAHCGSRMWRTRSKERWYLRCSGRFNGTCDAPFVQEQRVLDQAALLGKVQWVCVSQRGIERFE